MYNMLVNMALAAYLAPKPDKQVLKLARQYKSSTSNKLDKSTLKKIISSGQPAEVVKRTFLEVQKYS